MGRSAGCATASRCSPRRARCPSSSSRRGHRSLHVRTTPASVGLRPRVPPPRDGAVPPVEPVP
jgi:hypothetical protein